MPTHLVPNRNLILTPICGTELDPWRTSSNHMSTYLVESFLRAEAPCLACGLAIIKEVIKVIE